MITSNAQYRSTRALLHKFEEARTNLCRRDGRTPTGLEQLELDAVTAQAGDLRSELAEYEDRLPGERLLPHT